MPKLVLPSVKYKKSFLEDFLAHEEMQGSYTLTGIPKSQAAKRFPEFIRKLRAQARGAFEGDLGYAPIPQTVYWLVEGRKFLGKTDIRHRLNSHLRKIGGHIGYYIRPDERGKGYGRLILKLGLEKAKLLGIKNAVITCDITNIKSKKVIEANSGKLLGKTKQGKGLPDKLRFRIKT